MHWGLWVISLWVAGWVQGGRGRGAATQIGGGFRLRVKANEMGTLRGRGGGGGEQWPSATGCLLVKQ